MRICAYAAMLQADFSPAANWAAVPAATKATGQLPAGWSDQSAWGEAQPEYSALTEGGVAFLRIAAEGKNKAQISHPLAHPGAGVRAFRVHFTARSASKAGMLFGFRQADHPEHSDYFYTAGLVSLTPEWQDFDVTIRGELPATPVAFYLNFGTPAEVDLAALTVEPLALDDYTPATTVPLIREPAAVEHHRHMDTLAKTTQPPVVFFGDSITDGWDNPTTGLPVWEQSFGPMGVVNFGIGANRVEHLLWQAEHSGLGADYQPRVIVVMIGINNLFRIHSLLDLEEGMKILLTLLREKSPASRILLQGVLPQGFTPMPRRGEIAEINRRYAAMADGEQIVFFDWGAALLTPEGNITEEISGDGTHLKTPGYRIWADQLLPTLKGMLE